MIFRRWLLIYHEINFQYLSVHFQFSFSKDFLSDERNFYTHFHFYIITYILYCIGCRRINYWIYFNALGAKEKLPHTFLLHWVQEKRDVDLSICHFLSSLIFPNCQSLHQTFQVFIEIFKWGRPDITTKNLPLWCEI